MRRRRQPAWWHHPSRTGWLILIGGGAIGLAAILIASRLQ